LKRVLYDTNVLLDVILARQPHVVATAAALDLVARGRVDGYVAGHAVTTIAYLIQREKGAAEARKALAHLLSKLHVAAVTETSVRLALTMDFGDFEDAVCAASAQEAGCETVVTRNPQHFRKGDLPAILPDAFVASQLEQD
jgi:predicted nucleic acid-binding protein